MNKKPIPLITTAEELLRAPDFGPCELVRGKIVMTNYMGCEEGLMATGLAFALGNFVEQRKLGVVLTAPTGFRIARDPDSVRVPRVAFVRAGRIPPENRNDYVPGPPDLAVEIIAFPDRTDEVNDRVQDWLDAGSRLVWVIDPDARTLTVYRSRTEISVLGGSSTLSGGEVLPGFSLSVAEILAT